MAKKNLNLFRKSKQIKDQGRRSDQDYLDAFVGADEPKPAPEPDEAPTKTTPSGKPAQGEGQGAPETSPAPQPEPNRSPAPPAPREKPAPKPQSGETAVIRTTMTLAEADFETFRDVMHTVKSSGHYQYAQRDAFAEAVALLKAKVEAEIGPLRQAPPKKRGRW